MRVWRSILPSAIGAVVLGFSLERRTGAPSGQIQFVRDDVQQSDWRVHVATSHDREVERAHIVAHLARVEAKLRAASVAGYSPTQRAARQRNLDLLQEYRRRGVFPHNHIVTDRRTPVFIDRHGTHCAVGHLMARSGRADLARRIARTHNLATIAELADDAELRNWLEASGLAPVEAAMIQPSYGERPIDSVDETADAYVLGTIAATGVNGGLIAWNLLAARSSSDIAPGVLGLTLGLGQTVLGAVGVGLEDHGEHDLETAHIATNFVVGAVAAALGVRTLSRVSRGPAENAPPRTASTWSLAPWMPRTVDAGMRVSLRF